MFARGAEVSHRARFETSSPCLYSSLELLVDTATHVVCEVEDNKRLLALPRRAHVKRRCSSPNSRTSAQRRKFFEVGESSPATKKCTKKLEMLVLG